MKPIPEAPTTSNANLISPTSSADAGAINRREFVTKSAGAIAAGAALSTLAGCATDGARATLVAAPPVHVAGSGKIRVGLVGCGGRGTGAAVDCTKGDPGVEIVALGDTFADRIKRCREELAPKLGERMNVTDERCFVGFDAHQKVVDSGVNMVILTTPPAFRPMQLRSAVQAGKHVFMEKPVAVDPAGVRSVLESAQEASKRGLGIVAGTQRRHHAGYVEAMKRIHAGAIGEILSATCYWIGSELWNHARQPEWSDMEYQLRNWLYYTWISGDHIVEQHVHNLDVVNWALQAHPLKAMGMGGRQKRTNPAYGHIYDHFAVRYEYPGGVTVISMCRQNDNCATNVSEELVGTRGRSDANTWIANPAGRRRWEYKGAAPTPYVQEHIDLLASIRKGKPLNEAKQIAESTLTAIMGRESAYTGKEISWDEMLASPLSLVPEKLAFGPMPTPGVAIPGMPTASVS